MKNFVPIYKKEIKAFFSSPIAYTVIVMFQIMSGYFFYSVVRYYDSMSTYANRRHQTWEALSLMDGIFRPMYDNISVLLLFLVPIITMRLFAEEKKSGTIEMLFTYPLKDQEIITGKFLASLTVLVTMYIPTLLYPIIISMFGKIEWPVIVSTYLGLILMGMSFLSLGIFISSLTENQVIAAAGTFGMLITFWIIGWSTDFTNPGLASLGQVMAYLSLVKHFDNFVKGVIDTQDIIFYLIFNGYFLYLTYGILGSKKWRG